MESLTKFLQQQKILQIAPHAGNPWIANVYLASETPEKIYFVGSTARLYGEQLLEDPQLAFATAWHEANDLGNRRGVQGVGVATVVTDHTELDQAFSVYHARYPDALQLNTAWAVDDSHDGCLWKISPSFIKYWSDSDYGPEGSEKFTF